MMTLPYFLAHAIALETESAERFDELADALEIHFNTSVVGLFRKMAHFSRLHRQDVEQAAVGIDLPHFAPWDFRWPDAEAPETVTHEETRYQMTPRQALEAARSSEERGQAFYAEIAEKATDPEVRKLAAEFAAEEAEHVAMLSQWLSTTEDIHPSLLDDPDSPSSGE